MKPAAFNLPIRVLFFLFCVSPLVGKDFSIRIVDGLGRPVPDVVVDVHWLKKEKDGEVRKAELAKVKTNQKGVAAGTYDDKAIPADESTWVELSKAGYSGYTSDRLENEFVLKREFKAEDLDRIAKLSEPDRLRELEELLAGDLDGQDLESRVFVNDDLLSPALRRLLDNPRVAVHAFSLLSFIGVSEDLRLIVEKAPAPKKELFQDRWAYSVATALLSPTTEKEWSFLRSCAFNEYDDLWVDAGAIQTLKLIASPKSRAILEQIPTKNPDRSDEAKAAVDYINAKPAPLSDRSLTNVAERVAKAVKIGSWKGNKPPTFNSSSDKALVQCEFRTGRDLLVYTATFHKVGEAWVLRGVRETMQALLAKDADSDESGKK
jgi:hypothetical protein